MRRTEYPRPNFKREKWKCLNGVWKFYYGNKKTEIEVPFVCQSQLSGIGERITEDFVVYENEFTVPKEWKGRKSVLILEQLIIDAVYISITNV